MYMPGIEHERLGVGINNSNEAGEVRRQAVVWIPAIGLSVVCNVQRADTIAGDKLADEAGRRRGGCVVEDNRLLRSWVAPADGELGRTGVQDASQHI